MSPSGPLPSSPAPLEAPAESLLKTAERLFAIKGVDNVSTRQIAREAGQKNHSAIQYHFGSRDDLIEAILDYRVIPLNQYRWKLLNRVIADNAVSDIASLVEIMVRPLAEELLKPVEDSYYISLLQHLFTREDGEKRFHVRHRTDALWATSRYLMQALELPEKHINLRLRFMGTQVVNEVARWDRERHQQHIEFTAQEIEHRASHLISFIAGGLIQTSQPAFTIEQVNGVDDER